MFEFINKNEEIDALVNRTIVEEFDYVNKISFLHSAVRKYFPEIYQDNLNGLSEPFSKLLELKETYEREVGKSLNEPSYSVLNIGGFLDSIIGDDIEEAQANIDKLDKLFKTAVRLEVEKRLAGNAPKGNGAAASAEMTKEEYMKLPLSKQQELYATNRELVEKLLK